MEDAEDPLSIDTIQCASYTADITNGVIRTGYYATNHLLTRDTPFKTIKDILRIGDEGVHIKTNIPSATAIVPKAGTVLLIDRDHKGLHDVTEHNGQRTRLITKHGFMALFFLPEIKDMARFQREILDSTAVLREAAQRISALVECWTAKWNPNGAEVLIEWDSDLGKQFLDKEYPALEALEDHRYHEEEEQETIAERMLNRKRQRC
jgi:hypothetical protein